MFLAIFLMMGCVGVVSAESASFTANQTSGDAPLYVQFTNTSTGSPTAYSWNFGDDTSLSTEENPSHTFSTAGTYTVVLNITYETSYAQYSKTITVSSPSYDINSVTVSGISAPVAGETPVASASVISDPTGKVGATTAVSWTYVNGTSFTGNFEYGTAYKANLTISTTAEDYIFYSSTTFDVVNASELSPDFNSDYTNAVITYTYPATLSASSTTQNITSLAITLTAPETGIAPSSTVSAVSSPTGGVGTPVLTWSSSPDVFAGDTYYTASVVIPVADGSVFTSSTTATINGYTGTIESQSSTSMTVNYTFAKTSSTTQNITSLAITLTAPQTGIAPSSTVSAVSSPTGGVGTPVLTWSSSPDVFAGDTYYTASVVIPVADGSVFTSSTTATINGYTGTIESQSSTSMTVNYTFAKTSSSLLPTITLSTNVTSGTLPLTVKFTYTVVNSTSTTWTYGDGSSATFQYMSSYLTHTYTTAGTYTANLTATNANGTVYKSVNITVNKIGLDAAFTASAGSGTAPLKVWFTDTSAGSPTTWLWDFGGLGSSTLKNPSYTFTTAGNYIVKLIVIDSSGATDTYSKVITVNALVATSTPTPTPTEMVSSLSMSFGTGNINSLILSPVDIIKEFVQLFHTIIDMENYVGASNQTNTT